MSIETTPTSSSTARLTATYRPEPSPEAGRHLFAAWRGSPWDQPWRIVALVILATGFVLINGAALDLGPVESRLGLAANESFGPLGQKFGAWDPGIWPAQLAPSLAWAWGEGRTPTANSVRWPAAIAGVLAGLVLARRLSRELGGRAGVLVGACWFGCLALMDRSAGAGVDLLTGLATVAAFDRLLARGSDLVAGGWLALAFLAGGWPPVAIALLATVVLGRHGATLTWRLILPPVLAIAGWSAWALRVMPSEAWAAALALPLTQKPAWWLIPGVLALGFPWSPLALQVAGRSMREGWPAPTRTLLVGWGQVTLVCLLAGTVVPGLATAAAVPALAGLAMSAAAACERLIARPGDVGRTPLRWFFGATLALTLGWTLLIVIAGGYLAAAVAYYRVLAVGLAVSSVPLAALAVVAAARHNTRWAVCAVFGLAVCLRLAHWGYYVPEWNYRCSQGPWGRAIGQWMPLRWPIYTIHTWPADFAFATGHPVYQLPSERHLEYQPGDVKFVLLLASEFENWPATAPKLVKMAESQDEYGEIRILARTPGDLPWTALARSRLGRPTSGE